MSLVFCQELPCKAEFEKSKRCKERYSEDSDGNIHGKYISYFEDGSKENVRNYIHGKLEGHAKEMSNSVFGNEGNYVNGELQGCWVAGDLTGKDNLEYSWFEKGEFIAKDSKPILSFAAAKAIQSKLNKEEAKANQIKEKEEALILATEESQSAIKRIRNSITQNTIDKSISLYEDFVISNPNHPSNETAKKELKFLKYYLNAWEGLKFDLKESDKFTDNLDNTDLKSFPEVSTKYFQMATELYWLHGLINKVESPDKEDSIELYKTPFINKTIGKIIIGNSTFQYKNGSVSSDNLIEKVVPNQQGKTLIINYSRHEGTLDYISVNDQIYLFENDRLATFYGDKVYFFKDGVNYAAVNCKDYKIIVYKSAGSGLQEVNLPDKKVSTYYETFGKDLADKIFESYELSLGKENVIKKAVNNYISVYSYYLKVGRLDMIDKKTCCEILDWYKKDNSYGWQPYFAASMILFKVGEKQKAIEYLKPRLGETIVEGRTESYNGSEVTFKQKLKEFLKFQVDEGYLTKEEYKDLTKLI